ncbi:pilus assembly protein TadG-related protein [Microvirga sp. KLBC 81]|uniref:pilus assembly protein TadG-related protein n=1 Tax=Microvirga sp. KLBC 81 TaxID=1862707 RepID=UPI0014020AC9|nr:pilus assembly protein TadG-related protein [Microvirga sp. KLBC 81]
MSGVLSRVSKFWKNEGGATAVAVGLMSPVVIGGMALGGETGYWYYTQRKLQHAADVAAHAAGVRKRAGESGVPLRAAATQVAAASGFLPVMTDADPDPAITQPIATNLTINNPPQTGSFVGNTKAVEVVLSETKPRLLSSIFSNEAVEIKARAVVRLDGGSPACVVALSETKPKAVEVSGNTSVTLNDCSIAANSVQPDAYYMPNSTADLTADCISTVGGSSIKDPSSGLLELKVCESVQENAPPVADPYADVPEPVTTGCDEANKVVSGSVETERTDPIYGPIKIFCSGIEVEANTTAEFKSGLYVITSGELKVNNNATLKATGATFFFANNTTASISGSAVLDLTAPTTGMFAGLVFYGASCEDAPTECGEVFKITGNSSTTSIKGAIYLPGSTIEFLGGTNASSSCLQIIADKVTFTGNSEIEMGAACAGTGTKTVLIGEVVKLVE